MRAIPALWGTKESASTVSDLNQKIYGKTALAVTGPFVPGDHASGKPIRGISR